MNKPCMIVLAAISLALGADASRAADLECPSLADLNTPAQATEIADLLPKGLALEQPDQLASAITLMREHGLSADNAINHLVTLYCPAVAAEAGLTASEKVAHVKRFAQQAASLVLKMNTVDDVIYDVPLSADVAQAAKERAGMAGLTVEAWIAQTVNAAIR